MNRSEYKQNSNIMVFAPIIVYILKIVDLGNLSNNFQHKTMNNFAGVVSTDPSGHEPKQTWKAAVRLGS